MKEVVWEQSKDPFRHPFNIGTFLVLGLVFWMFSEQIIDQTSYPGQACVDRSISSRLSSPVWFWLSAPYSISSRIRMIQYVDFCVPVRVSISRVCPPSPSWRYTNILRGKKGTCLSKVLIDGNQIFCGCHIICPVCADRVILCFRFRWTFPALLSAIKLAVLGKSSQICHPITQGPATTIFCTSLQQWVF